MLRTLMIVGALSLVLTADARADEKSVAGITVDVEKRAVRIDAKVAPRKLEYLKGEIYPIEVVACWAHPKGRKAHETIVTIEAAPSAVHKALESLGLKAGEPIVGESKEPAKGPEVRVSIEVPGPDDRPKKLTMDKVLVNPASGKPFPKDVKFRFTGSIISQPDPSKPDKVYGADQTGTLIAIYPVTNETVLQTSLTMKEEKFLKLETNKSVLPPEGTPVKLVIEAVEK